MVFFKKLHIDKLQTKKSENRNSIPSLKNNSVYVNKPFALVTAYTNYLVRSYPFVVWQLADTLSILQNYMQYTNALRSGAYFLPMKSIYGGKRMALEQKIHVTAGYLSFGQRMAIFALHY